MDLLPSDATLPEVIDRLNLVIMWLNDNQTYTIELGTNRYLARVQTAPPPAEGDWDLVLESRVGEDLE